jgi:hypothetical protein
MRWTALLLLIFCGPLWAAEPLHLTKYSLEGDLAPGSNGLLSLSLSLNEGHRAYVDQFRLESPYLEGLKSSKLKLAPVMTSKDPHSERIRQFVTQDFRLETVIELPEALKQKPKALDLELRYQACTMKYCYSPKTLKLHLPARQGS